ncbi:MAG TPA: hypothetical protein VF223_13025 [Trebonia sp.]
MPADGLYDSRNVLVRKGRLEPRPGLTVFDATPLDGRVIGAYSAISIVEGAFQDDTFQNDAFQTEANAPSSTLVACTPTSMFLRTAAGWQDVTDTPLLAGDDSHARFTSIFLNNVLHVLMTNGVDAPRELRSDQSVIQVIAGTPPRFTDWTTLAGQARVVGIVPPFDIRWSNIADIGSWPALNVANLSGTPDRLVAIRNLGTLGVAVYKTHTIWLGVTTGLPTEAAALRFELRGWFDGPASPAAVVDAQGIHYYMTENGRVAAFSGTQHQWVADGVWPLVQDTLDMDRTNRIFGFWEPTRDEVYFVYPRTDDPSADNPRGLVMVLPPRPSEGRQSYTAFTGVLGRGLSCAVDLRLNTKDVVAFGAQDRVTYKFTGPDDAGVAITGYWQTGLTRMPGINPHRIEAIETFAERGVGYGALTVRPVFSNLLDQPSGSFADPITISLADTKKVTDLRGVDAKGRFLGLRYEFSSATANPIRWRGARLVGRPGE